MPIRFGRSGCCADAASGSAITAPPSERMKPRRWIWMGHATLPLRVMPMQNQNRTGRLGKIRSIATMTRRTGEYVRRLTQHFIFFPTPGQQRWRNVDGGGGVASHARDLSSLHAPTSHHPARGGRIYGRAYGLPCLQPSWLGRMKLATRPNLTGSTPLVNTMGIVVVTAFAAIAAGGPPAKIISTGGERRNSATRAGNRS